MSVIKTNIRLLLRKPSVWLSTIFFTDLMIGFMRRVNQIQLSVAEIKLIMLTIRQKPTCGLLVFGVGNDSLLWVNVNKLGSTLFVEDNIEWSNKVKRRDGISEIKLVDYKTQRTQWMQFIEYPEKLDLESFESIVAMDWDVVLVDAPAGWNDSTPGRMKSIYLSSILAKPSVDVFVHDCNREIEQKYCDTFLGSENLKSEIDKLRHYHFE